MLVDTEGLVVEARVHSAKVPDQDGIMRLLEPARSRLGSLSYLWVDAGYRGKEWTERALGLEVEVVNRSPKPPPERSYGSGLGSGSKRGARWTLVSLSKPSRETVKADQRATQEHECLVDVVAPLVADSELAKLGEPRQRPLHHPPVPTQLLGTLHLFLAMRLVIPCSSSARAHFLSS